MNVCVSWICFLVKLLRGQFVCIILFLLLGVVFLYTYAEVVRYWGIFILRVEFVCYVSSDFLFRKGAILAGLPLQIELSFEVFGRKILLVYAGKNVSFLVIIMLLADGIMSTFSRIQKSQLVLSPLRLWF